MAIKKQTNYIEFSFQSLKKWTELMKKEKAVRKMTKSCLESKFYDIWKRQL